LQRNRGPVVSVQPACNVRTGGPHILGHFGAPFLARGVLPFCPVLFNHCRAFQSLQTLLISELITPIGSSRFEARRRCSSIVRRELRVLYTLMGLGGSCLEKDERRHIGCFWRGRRTSPLTHSRLRFILDSTWDEDLTKDTKYRDTS
jgi:hypothetical protein